MICKDSLSCLRSEGVFIFRKCWVHMLCPGNEFTKAGYLTCSRRFFYENAFLCKGLKIVQIFIFNRQKKYRLPL